MKRKSVMITVLAAVCTASLTSCWDGDTASGTCEEACARLHKEPEHFRDETVCGLTYAGVTPAKGEASCLYFCDAAMQNEEGEAREDYESGLQSGSHEVDDPRNRKEIELWIECVMDMECIYLADGFCSPHF